MECREQKGYQWCRGMYLGVRKVEGVAEVHGACRADWKARGAGGLLESDGWVAEVQKVEVGVWKVEAET